MQGKTQICIKINGVTFIKTTITDGLINVEIPTDTFENPTYKLTIILGENSLYNKATYNGTLIVVKPQIYYKKNSTSSKIVQIIKV